MAQPSPTIAAMKTMDENQALILRPARWLAAATVRAEPGRGERAAALAAENKRRLGVLLALQSAQRPQLVAQNGVRRLRVFLGAADVEVGGREVDLVPPQVSSETHSPCR
jgi:hypothetical protein